MLSYCGMIFSTSICEFRSPQNIPVICSLQTTLPAHLESFAQWLNALHRFAQGNWSTALNEGVHCIGHEKYSVGQHD